jgi:hypothetical protein
MSQMEREREREREREIYLNCVDWLWWEMHEWSAMILSWG